MAATVILREGPAEGAFETLPPGSLYQMNDSELHVPCVGLVAIYRRTETEAELPTWRYHRQEPTYR
jgi:hypothetical protein